MTPGIEYALGAMLLFGLGAPAPHEARAGERGGPDRADGFRRDGPARFPFPARIVHGAQGGGPRRCARRAGESRVLVAGYRVKIFLGIAPYTICTWSTASPTT